jgi:hypothetical protein
MVLPQILPYQWMPRWTRTFHPRLSAPSTRFDCSEARHLSQAGPVVSIGNLEAFRHSYRPAPPLCYYCAVGKGQTGKVAGQFIKHVVPAIAKPARALWNEVIGFIFICLAVSFGFTVLRYVRRGETFQIVVCSIATLLMLYYGISSFLRARKISRS